MLITALINTFITVLDTLLIFKIPLLPSDVYTFIQSGFEYLVTGASIIANYTPMAYLLVLFALILAIDSAVVIYHFVMWILKKIPILNIK